MKKNKTNRFVLFTFLIFGVLILSCAQIKPLQQATTSYNKGKFKEAEAVLKYYVETENAMKNPSYPIMLLVLADAQFRLGDYQSACRTYDAAIKSMKGELTTLQSTTNFLKSETNRPYRGAPHDLAFAHYYKGICYFQMEKYDKARIEFAKARKEDKGEKAGQENDLASVHFMEGLCYEKLKDFEEAAVSFRKVSKLKPEFPFAWMKLSFISEKMNDKFNSDKYWNKYLDIVPADQNLKRSNSTECIFLISDLGKGPYKSADFITGEFANYQKGVYLEDGFDVSIGEVKYGSGYQVEEIYYQAKTEGGFGGEVARKVVSKVAKTAVKQIPVVGALLAGGSAADTRTWYTLSGEIQMAFIPTNKDEEYVINIDYYDTDNNNNYLERYEQNWYYIPAQPLNEVKPVYLISMENLHNLNIDHNEIAKKIKDKNKKIKLELERR